MAVPTLHGTGRVAAMAALAKLRWDAGGFHSGAPASPARVPFGLIIYLQSYPVKNFLPLVCGSYTACGPSRSGGCFLSRVNFFLRKEPPIVMMHKLSF